ncbi:hypothetical protein [Pseudotabrizicola alkalilacus]|nr:hypothetical protein [Pseudotabrizicola alkalilacus]
MNNKRAADAATLMRERYVEIWPKILDPWTQYLISARSAFDGDMDKMIILAVIGLATLQDGRVLAHPTSSLKYDDLGDDRAKRADARPINIESISLYTGIPRESVRRKVRELIARRWVARDTRGYLVVLSAAAIDLEPLSTLLFRLIGRISNEINDHLSL